MQVIRIVLVAAAIFGANTAVGADDKRDDPGAGKWDYPAGRRGVSEVGPGKAGDIRVFDCETKDSAETVILWYAKRLGLDDDHSFVEAASRGFDQLTKDTHFHYSFGHDTDARRDDTQIAAHIRGGHAHVSFFHRPDYRLPSVVAISIAETPFGTSVHVIQPMMSVNEGKSDIAPMSKNSAEQ